MKVGVMRVKHSVRKKKIEISPVSVRQLSSRLGTAAVQYDLESWVARHVEFEPSKSIVMYAVTQHNASTNHLLDRL